MHGLNAVVRYCLDLLIKPAFRTGGDEGNDFGVQQSGVRSGGGVRIKCRRKISHLHDPSARQEWTGTRKQWIKDITQSRHSPRGPLDLQDRPPLPCVQPLRCRRGPFLFHSRPYSLGFSENDFSDFRGQIWIRAGENRSQTIRKQSQTPPAQWH